MSVCSDRLDFEDALFDGEERDIEGSSTEIEDQHDALDDEARCNGGSGRLVDDTQNIRPGDGFGGLGRLTLEVVEVGGNGRGGVRNGGAKVGFDGPLYLDKDQGGDFLWRLT